ncbi:hypothetical protein [Secundilactobacillus similis]|uniref:hypothetical protein n=1 Tax=Secundilactobacillus similis TaxID=414682 RepID=UPI000B21D008|nr:hypothetical protein [Secundilactobacillus similis]
MGLFDSLSKKKVNRNPHTAGGPVVKSGPTNGDVRSRNSDGSWRKKRSDAGSSRKK